MTPMRACINGPRPSAAMIKGLGRGLPRLQPLLGFGQFHDVVGRILKRDELAAAGQVDRIFEQPFPPCWRLMQRGQPGRSFWRIRFAGPVFRFGRNPVLRLCFGLEVPDMGSRDHSLSLPPQTSNRL
jgi:hypothetical protein